MRTALIATAAVFALAGCSTVAEPEATSVDPLPLVVGGAPDHATGDAATGDAATLGSDEPVEAAIELDTNASAEPENHDTDVAVTGTAGDIDPDVLTAMIVIVAGGDVDGAIEAGEFSDLDVLEALDHLAAAQS